MSSQSHEADAIVVGAGPNGLAAAVTLARAGLSVRVFERADAAGGGARTAALTLPGFLHDVCSAVHPLALASEFFRRFELAQRVAMVVPETSYAHPMPDGRAGVAYRDLDRTADGLGRDGAAWRRLLGPLVRQAEALSSLTGDQLLRLPAHPLTAARFGLRVLEQGGPFWNARFADETAPALLAGVFAHTIQRLPSPVAAATGLTLATYAHAGGWPVPLGGSRAITDALVDDLTAHGGELVLDHEVRTLDELPAARLVMLDVTPRALVEIAGDRLPAGYAAALRRFRYGNGVAKADFALSEPVPWLNAELRAAPTVHVGGTRGTLARAENAVARGRHAEQPSVLVSQPSIVDPSRAPAGGHVLWAYTHVPRGSSVDQTEAITREIERYAPGFRDTVLATASRTAQDLETYNPNDVGGDIAAGEVSLRQLLSRPVPSRNPWRTPLPGVYLCSASTPPGPGVHGLAGWRAALSALRAEYGVLTGPELGRGTQGPPRG